MGTRALHKYALSCVFTLRCFRLSADYRNMRCLYCGKQLAFLRRLTGGGEFCSEAHKHSYHDEYNRLALSRLMQAKTRGEEPVADGGQLPASPRSSLDAQGWTAVNEAGQKGLSAVPGNGARFGTPWAVRGRRDKPVS